MSEWAQSVKQQLSDVLGCLMAGCALVVMCTVVGVVLAAWLGPTFGMYAVLGIICIGVATAMSERRKGG